MAVSSSVKTTTIREAVVAKVITTTTISVAIIAAEVDVETTRVIAVASVVDMIIATMIGTEIRVLLKASKISRLKWTRTRWRNPWDNLSKWENLCNFSRSISPHLRTFKVKSVITSLVTTSILQSWTPMVKKKPQPSPVWSWTSPPSIIRSCSQTRTTSFKRCLRLMLSSRRASLSNSEQSLSTLESSQAERRIASTGGASPSWANLYKWSSGWRP